MVRGSLRSHLTMREVGRTSSRTPGVIPAPAGIHLGQENRPPPPFVGSRSIRHTPTPDPSPQGGGRRWCPGLMVRGSLRSHLTMRGWVGASPAEGPQVSTMVLGRLPSEPPSLRTSPRACRRARSGPLRPPPSTRLRLVPLPRERGRMRGWAAGLPARCGEGGGSRVGSPPFLLSVPPHPPHGEIKS
jgi:hypothetical protein